MIESVQSQAHDDWQLLLVDDGSNDRTAEIIQDFAATDERIVPVSLRERFGKVEAFNRAAAAADGQVNVVLGADDRMADGALELRAKVFSGFDPEVPVIAFHKIRMFSDDQTLKPLVLPRGAGGARSGPGISFNSALAKRVLPVPSELVSEDIWISEAGEAAAEVVVSEDGIVTEYRVHGGNSNPRHKMFDEMTEAIHSRMRARELVAERPVFTPTDEQIRRLQAQLRAEEARYNGRTMSILRESELSITDRLAVASMSRPTLWALRRRFFRSFTGRRGR
jgi:glycosyltransferase involved in cell wall biosynthesis